MSRYVKKPRKTNANSRGRTVNKGNVRNKAGKVASNSKAKVNSKQKEGLMGYVSDDELILLETYRNTTNAGRERIKAYAEGIYAAEKNK